MKTITKWFTAGATISLLTATPVLASDSSIDAAQSRARQRIGHVERDRAPVKNVKRDTAKETAKQAADVRPCCVAHGVAVYDHLRG
jgi:hypothetical protein